MRWTTDLSKDLAGTPKSNIHPRSTTSHYITALLRYSIKKRKLESGEHGHLEGFVPSTNKFTSLRTMESRCPKRICNAINKSEIKAIQMQIAMLSDEDGDRPIHVAVANEDFRLVQKLCNLMAKNSIPLDVTNYLRQTPLHLAVILGNTQITKLLLNFGSSPLVSDRNGNSVLHLAVKSNTNKDVLEVLLSHPQIKTILNSMDYEGYTAVHYAVLKNNSVAVQALRDSGADIDKIDGKSGRTALIHAVLEQNIDMVNLLLNCGSCPQKNDYSGRCAFEMALQISNVQIIKCLEKWMPEDDMTTVKGRVNSLLETSAKATKRTKKANEED